MSNDRIPNTQVNEKGDQISITAISEPPRNVNNTPSSASPTLFEDKTTKLNDVAVRNNNNNLNDKSDSEAETVVLDGKGEAAPESKGKAIKNEDQSEEEETSPGPQINGFDGKFDREGKTNNGSNISRKRKRLTLELTAEEHGNSSNLSSTTSSPVPRPHSSQDSDSESDRSHSGPPADENNHQKQSKHRKRKLESDVPDRDRKKRGKSDPNSIAVNRKERRETRSATHNEITRHRSESPPSRRHKRAQSTQLFDQQEKHKRKKAPPPLFVDRHRKVSEDTHGDSDDSSSVHSHPHLQKVASVDYNAMSPAKLSHKKNRDKNGRTPLARACAIDIGDAEKRLRERPQDINVPDNAGNTPLQIASLEGLADIVKLLLDAGCDTTCKNIDLETPLIDAVENGHLEVVQLLLNAGLDPRQGNAKGEEPLDLVNPDNDDYEEIREALRTARESDTIRRPSEDQNAQHRDTDISSMGASAASPTDGPPGRSPPPLGPGARRRTARSQPTQDSLLWVNPTPAKLRDACGTGNLSVVDHILRMRPMVGTDAVIAAARGGHDVVLEILFAIGELQHDPDPLADSDLKPGRDTPMLAAIGRGHIAVIKLLVSQPGFDPTRRLFRNLTYHEIAKERKGSNWEEEYKILKEAYDDYTANGGRRSNHGSPRKVRTKRPESGRPTPDRPSSPHTTVKRQHSQSSVKTAPEPDAETEDSCKANSSKHLQVPESDTKDSAILSDRDSESIGRTVSKFKENRSVSDVGAASSKHSEPAKPRRKLLSRNDLNSDHGAKRRASLATDAPNHDILRRRSGNSVDAHQDRQKRKSSHSPTSMHKVKNDTNQGLPTPKEELGKKRPRISTSPQPGISQTENMNANSNQKKKRRFDTESSATSQDAELNSEDATVRSGPAMVANMIASPESVISPSEIPGRAPIANMGVSSASPITKSPTDLPAQTEIHSPMSGIEQTVEQDKRGTSRSSAEELDLQFKRAELERDTGKRFRDLDQVDEYLRQAEERRLQTAREERQRQVEEAQRQAQKEQEEEQSRIARQRRDEELARRRSEQERIRREDQDRRRAELEERERIRRIRAQEEEEQQRRDALPNSLRRAAELSPEKARQPQEIKRWLPLFTVTAREINPGCEDELADERWISNVQAAPILAIKDLDLSQCRPSHPFPILPSPFLSLSTNNTTNSSVLENLIVLKFERVLTRYTDTAWTRLPRPPNKPQSLLRQVRNQMSQANINPLTFTFQDAYHLDQDTYPKFHNLKSVFWIKLADFMDIVPRHPHLSGLKLSTRAMVIHADPWGQNAPAPAPSSVSSAGPNVAENGVNGYASSSPHEVAAPLVNGYR